MDTFQLAAAARHDARLATCPTSGLLAGARLPDLIPGTRKATRAEKTSVEAVTGRELTQADGSWPNTATARAALKRWARQQAPA